MPEDQPKVSSLLLRTFLFCVVLAMTTYYAVAVAMSLAAYVNATPSVWAATHIDWVTKTLSYGIIIALAKDVVMVLVSVPARAQSIRVADWLGDAAKIFFAVVGCVLAFETYKPDTKVEALSLLPAYPVVMQPGDASVIAVLPVFYVNNASKDDGGNWRDGVVIDDRESPGALDRIGRLVSRLAESCAPTSSSQTIRLNVVGYASSAEFRGQSQSDSDRSNMVVANERATAANSVLAAQTSRWSGFEITRRNFTDPQKMFAERTYLDRLGGKMSPQHESLNRRVEIRLLEAGSCTDRETLLESLR